MIRGPTFPAGKRLICAVSKAISAKQSPDRPVGDGLSLQCTVPDHERAVDQHMPHSDARQVRSVIKHRENLAAQTLWSADVRIATFVKAELASHFPREADAYGVADRASGPHSSA